MSSHDWERTMAEAYAARRKLKQGFSISELQAAGEEDSDDEDVDAEEEEEDIQCEDIQHVASGNHAQEDEMDDVQVDHERVLLDDKLDEQNEIWVRNHFEKGHAAGKGQQDRAVLCCPACFVALSYLSRPTGTSWEADKVVNCIVLPLNSQQSNSNCVACAECRTLVGIRRNSDGKFLFRDVLPSTTTPQQL